MKVKGLRSYELPIPTFAEHGFGLAGVPRRVDYAALLSEAGTWRKRHDIKPRRTDKKSVALIGIDMQDTFSHDGAELVVPGAVADGVRFASFLYRNMRVVSDVVLTLDTHFLVHIFHPVFWLDGSGNHPAPFTAITKEDLLKGHWVPNPEMAYLILGDMNRYAWLKRYVVHYAETLEKKGKPPLVVWPFHSPVGGIGYALMPAVEEAASFHQLVRYGKLTKRIKGMHPLTEGYSAFGDEVTVAHDGTVVGEESDAVVKDILDNDLVIIGGEALSHCVAASIYDILSKIRAVDPALASRVRLLGDCMSPVPGFEAQGQAALHEFVAAGMHLDNSEIPMEKWKGIDPDLFS